MNAPSPTATPYGRPITLDEARRVIDAAAAVAADRGWPVSICVVDSGDNVKLLARMDNAHLASADIARRKAGTAVSMRRPTKVFEDLVASGGLHLRLLAAGDLVAPLEGGLPLIKDGAVIGAVGVSGAQSFEDAEIARAGIAVL